MTVRQTAPMPPKMLVPPSATPAIASSARFCPRTFEADPWPVVEASIRPASPQAAPVSDEGDDDDAVDLQARQARGVAVPADAVEVPAEDGVGEHELQHDGDDQEDEIRVLDAADRALADEGEDVAPFAE